MKSLSERETTVEHYHCKNISIIKCQENKNAFVNYSTSPRQAIIQLLNMIL